MSKVRIMAGVPADGTLRVVVLTEAGLGLSTLQVEDRDRRQSPQLLALNVPVTSGEVAGEFRRQGVQILHGSLSGFAPGSRLRLFALDGQRTTLAYADVDVPPAQLPSQGLCFAVASCFYKDFRMAAAYRNALQANFLGANSFKLLIGDNLYLDTAHSEKGLDTGPVETVYRYLDYWWNDEYGNVLSHLPSLFTFDDHELWNNYPENVKWLSRTRGSLRNGYERAGLECLDLFQSSLNPPSVAPAARDRSLATKIAGVPFFFLDMRSRRQFRTGDASRMASLESMAALRAWLANLPGPGFLVLGQPLVQGFGSSFDWQPPDFGSQFSELWSLFESAAHDIVLLSGDVHHSRVLELAVGRRRIFELVTSPASHIPSIFSVADGSFGSQERGKVGFPSRPPLRVPRAGQVAPAVVNYWLGTTAPNTIAQLRLSPHGDGGIAVGLAYVDLGAGTGPRIADSATGEIDGKTVAPRHPYGLIPHLTILH